MLEETVGNKLNKMCTDSTGYKMSESHILRGIDAGGGEKWRRRRTAKLGTLWGKTVRKYMPKCLWHSHLENIFVSLQYFWNKTL